jgi:hypothetical protein
LSIDLPFMNDGPQFAIVHETNTMNGPSSTRIVIQPSVDYFIAPNVSVGGELGIDHLSVSTPSPPYGYGQATNNSTGATAISAEARVGYNVSLTETVSLWPRLGLGYVYTTTSFPYAPDATGHSIPLSLSVPFLWHPGGHFFVGGGPAIVTQLSNEISGANGSKSTDYGLLGLIGGTIGGG